MSLPSAKIKPNTVWYSLWLIPMITLILTAITLFQSEFRKGPIISIQLQQGYGLKPGDPLRYRGISIGKVESVALASNLMKHIIVQVRLSHEARNIAHSGSLFWVVRPQVGIQNITGLDTLIGRKYLSVLPGHGVYRNSFIGLENPPIHKMMASDGLEVLLRAKHNGGVSPGSLVKYRQHPVGIVLSVNLSSDASAIQIRILIEPQYTVLIQENTVFWQSGGVNIKGGISGFDLRVGSLQDLFQGGISLAVPEHQAKQAKPGHPFVLYSKPKDEWIQWTPILPLRSTALKTLPNMPIASISWQYKQYGFLTNDSVNQGRVLAFKGGFLGLSSLLQAPNDALPDSTQLSIEQQLVKLHKNKNPMALHFLPAPHKATPWQGILRNTTIPEDVFIVGGSALTVKQISAIRFSQTPVSDKTNEQQKNAIWQVDPQLKFASDWNGAAVIAISDNAIIGFLSVKEKQMSVLLSPLKAIK